MSPDYWTEGEALAARGSSELLAATTADLSYFLPRDLDLGKLGNRRERGEPFDPRGDWVRHTRHVIAAHMHFALTGSSAWLDYLHGGARPDDFVD